MHYKQSGQIRSEIEKAKNIVINCHTSPDADSIGSALALSGVLRNQGKTTTIICPEEAPESLSFLDGWKDIKRVNFSEFDFTGFDLFFLLDTSSWKRATGKSGVAVPEITKIIIDHHADNERFGDIHLVDPDAGSTSEILYLLFSDLEYTVNSDAGSAVLAGIAGDSSGFWNTGAGQTAFEIVSKLIETGVDKSKIISEMYTSFTPASLGLLGETLRELKIDTKHNFIWSAIPHDTYSRYLDTSALQSYSGIFFRAVKNTEFGLLFLEKDPGKLEFSIKSRSGCDVSRIAKALGGGGHKRAGGGIIPCDNFAAKVEELLAIVRSSAG